MSEATIEKTTIVTTGRRKTSSARVRMTTGGSGKITINGKDGDTYLYHESLQRLAYAPIKEIEAENDFDFTIRVVGGGPTGQAGAICLGIARALERHNSELRPPLKKKGYLKRDPRDRERKKAGQPGARKKFQFSKR